jgi:hypothetical protein
VAAPDGLTLKMHRDLEGRRGLVWVRRVLLALLALVVLLALVNAFGQRPSTSTAVSPGATLKVYAPERLRGGLVYAARFRIHAIREIEDATLVLDPGWAEQYTFNGAAPQPLTEASRDGKLAFGFGHLPAGRSLLFFVSLQVNPTNVGRRSQNVELDDGTTRLALVRRHVTIFP